MHTPFATTADSIVFGIGSAGIEYIEFEIDLRAADDDADQTKIA